MTLLAITLKDLRLIVRDRAALLFIVLVPIVVITCAVLIGKVVTRTIGVFVAGNDPRTSLRVAVTLAQIGEFSFIIAALGLRLG